MAYTKTTWLDKVVQYPMRFFKSGETSGGVTLSPDNGTVTQAGTPINAANLNKLEQGVQDAHTTADAALSRNTGGTVNGQTIVLGTGADDTNGLLRVENTSASTGAATSSQIIVRSKYGSAQLMKWAATGVRIGSRATANGDTGVVNFTYGNDTVGATLDGNGFDSVAGYKWNGVTMAQTRTTNGYVEWYNGSIWQGVGGVKNVQRGTVSIAGTTTQNITISAVVMNKTFVTFNNTVTLSSASSFSYANLTSTTNLAISNGTGNTMTFAWEVVESY